MNDYMIYVGDKEYSEVEVLPPFNFNSIHESEGSVSLRKFMIDYFNSLELDDMRIRVDNLELVKLVNDDEILDSTDIFEYLNLTHKTYGYDYVLSFSVLKGDEVLCSHRTSIVELPETINGSLVINGTKMTYTNKADRNRTFIDLDYFKLSDKYRVFYSRVIIINDNSVYTVIEVLPDGEVYLTINYYVERKKRSYYIGNDSINKLFNTNLKIIENTGVKTYKINDSDYDIIHNLYNGNVDDESVMPFLEYIKSDINGNDFMRELISVLSKVSNKEIEAKLLDRQSFSFRVITSPAQFVFEEVTTTIKNEFKSGNPEVFSTGKFLTNGNISSKMSHLFTSTPYCNFSDDINPISDLSGKRRLKVIVNNPTIEDRLFDISTMKNKICPVETPESAEIGITLNLSLDYGSKCNYKHLFGLPASMIPFILHNDANRCLMGASMIKQSLPLKYVNKNLVITDTWLATNKLSLIKSPIDGVVTNISNEIGNECVYINGDNKVKTLAHITSNYKNDYGNNIKVKVGDSVKKGDVIASNNFSSGSSTSLGVPLAVAYMPFGNGGNFEDSIIISERVRDEGLLDSVHCDIKLIGINTEDFILPTSKFIEQYNLNPKYLVDIDSFKNLIGVEHTSKDVLFHYYTKNKNLFESFISSVKSSRVSTLEYNVIKKKFRLHEVKKFTITNIYFKLFRDNKYELVDIMNLNKIPEDLVGVDIKFKYVKKIEVGDKLSGIHGNKGTISMIVPTDSLTAPDGTKIDLVMNTLGVPSRMNISQIYETICGRFCKEIRKICNNTGKLDKLISILKLFKDIGVNNKEFNRLLNDSINTPELVLNYLKDNDLQIVLQPFFNFISIFNNIADILNIDLDGDYLTFSDGSKTLEKVMWGYSTIIKLKHTVSSKIKCCNLKIVDEKSKCGGHRGQRSGEMEIWALESHNCNNILTEIANMTGDNNKMNKYVYYNNLQGRKTNLKSDEESRSFSDFKEYMKVLRFNLKEVEGE